MAFGRVLLVALTYVAAESLGESPPGIPPPGAISSVGDEERSPPLFRPGSQALVVQQPSPSGWGGEAGWGERRNCLLCESLDSGQCRAAPRCLHCESTVTALCDTVPCVRCSVIDNPFFSCAVGERYMAECASCRCADGHAGRCGRCSRRYGGHHALELYAMQLSDGDIY